MLRGPGAHPPRLGRPRGHVFLEGRLPREPRAAWRLVHRRPGRRPGELRSHHEGRAGGNEKRFLHSSEGPPRALAMGFAISNRIDGPRSVKILKAFNI